MAAAASGISITTSFYKKNEYFDVCEINGSKFALFSKQIESDKTLSINLSDYNVVLLAPVQSEENVLIKAISVIALSSLKAKKGETEINASGKFISLGSTIESHLDNKISGDKGVFFLDVIKERLEMILEEFDKGILDEHGPTIANALIHTFDAVEDPSGENEDVDNFKAFEFFNISY
jgi:hypothetical protein